jgi:calcium-independent phospholipase A2-gamma
MEQTVTNGNLKLSANLETINAIEGRMMSDQFHRNNSLSPKVDQIQETYLNNSSISSSSRKKSVLWVLIDKVFDVWNEKRSSVMSVKLSMLEPSNYTNLNHSLQTSTSSSPIQSLPVNMKPRSSPFSELPVEHQHFASERFVTDRDIERFAKHQEKPETHQPITKTNDLLFVDDLLNLFRRLVSSDVSETGRNRARSAERQTFNKIRNADLLSIFLTNSSNVSATGTAVEQNEQGETIFGWAQMKLTSWVSNLNNWTGDSEKKGRLSKLLNDQFATVQSPSRIVFLNSSHHNSSSVPIVNQYESLLFRWKDGLRTKDNFTSNKKSQLSSLANASSVIFSLLVNSSSIPAQKYQQGSNNLTNVFGAIKQIWNKIVPSGSNGSVSSQPNLPVPTKDDNLDRFILGSNNAASRNLFSNSIPPNISEHVPISAKAANVSRNLDSQNNETISSWFELLVLLSQRVVPKRMSMLPNNGKHNQSNDSVQEQLDALQRDVQVVNAGAQSIQQDFNPIDPPASVREENVVRGNTASSELSFVSVMKPMSSLLGSALSLFSVTEKPSPSSFISVLKDGQEKDSNHLTAENDTMIELWEQLHPTSVSAAIAASAYKTPDIEEDLIKLKSHQQNLVRIQEPVKNGIDRKPHMDREPGQRNIPREIVTAALLQKGENFRNNNAEGFQSKTSFLEDIPFATNTDFAFLAEKKTEAAVRAANAVKSDRDALEYLKDIGLDPLYAVLRTSFNVTQLEAKIDAVAGLLRLIIAYKPLAEEIGQNAVVIEALCDLLNAPNEVASRKPEPTFLQSLFSIFNSKRGDKDGHSAVAAERESLILTANRAQRESLKLVLRLVRSNDVAVQHMRKYPRLRALLFPLMMTTTTPANATASLLSKKQQVEQKDQGNLPYLYGSRTSLATPSKAGIQMAIGDDAKVNKLTVVRKRNSTTIVDYTDLEVSQMARVAHWGLGGVAWKAKQSGHRGIRILSFDGGGTRGVLTLSYLKEIFQRVAGNPTQGSPSLCPSDYFDIICGTSTGGIIAMLLGAQCRSVHVSEVLYDEFIGKIFANKSNLKLVTEQAAYDETEFEKILYKMCGDSLMLDSNLEDCARVFCVSTKVNSNPPTPHLWRNYDYPSSASIASTASSSSLACPPSRYSGAFRVNTITAVRATTAAPTFFTPVPWEGDLFADGALVANNPTGIAIQEAKRLYPGVPIECVVSIGTGYCVQEKANMLSMGWDTLVNQLIASSTDTEDVHAMLQNFLPEDTYFRFNPLFSEEIPIDVKDRLVLNNLKLYAKAHYKELENGPDAARYSKLIQLLRGESSV